MPKLTTQQSLDTAMRLHGAGRLREAERLYRQILATHPANANAMHLLGVIAHQSGRNDEAIDLIRRAIAIKPNFPEAHSNLGITLAAIAKFDEAIAAYQQTIALAPRFPGAHINLGIALTAKGKLDEAISIIREAIAFTPNYAEGYVNLGNALKARGELDNAIAAYRQAIAFNPKLSQAHNNLGNALKETGQLEEAIAVYREVISFRPNYAEAHSNLGNALQEKGHLDEAISVFRHAITLNPNLPEAHNNLGIILRDKGKNDEAIAECRKAISLRPDFAEAYHNLASALITKGQLDEAIDACHRAIAIKPDYAKVFNCLGNALKDKGHLDDAIAAYRRAIELDPKDVGTHSNLLFSLHYHPTFGASAIAEEHRRWNQLHADPLINESPSKTPRNPHSNNPAPDRRLRLGYISADLRKHPVGRFILPLLEQHDHDQFEIFCYSNSLMSDEITSRIQSSADHWRKIAGQTDEQVADQIRADEIDILIDLSGHTGRHRLLVFARKPAPLQISYLGYPAPTGLSTINYRLTDHFADPADQPDQSETEKPFRLPRTNWCFKEMETSPPVEPSPALRHGYVTFGSFNNFSKVTDEMLALWARILREVPNSRLLLKSSAFGSPSVQTRVREIFAAQEIDAARLNFIGLQANHSSHLALYNDMDIALDAFPYHGTTTTCDALWMGVPVITLAGQTHVSRVGLSLLSNLGLPELVAYTPDQYAQIAIDLAKNTTRMNNLRLNMRTRMQASPLMDAPQFARDIENAFRQMWRTCCETARP